MAIPIRRRAGSEHTAWSCPL